MKSPTKVVKMDFMKKVALLKEAISLNTVNRVLDSAQDLRRERVFNAASSLITPNLDKQIHPEQLKVVKSIVGGMDEFPVNSDGFGIKRVLDQIDLNPGIRPAFAALRRDLARTPQQIDRVKQQVIDKLIRKPKWAYTVKKV